MKPSFGAIALLSSSLLTLTEWARADVSPATIDTGSATPYTSGGHGPVASSDGPKPPEPPAPTTQAHWYGWQIFLIDAAGAVPFAVAAAAKSSSAEVPTGVLWINAYLFGGPIVHIAHHRPGVAGLSFALRLGLPILGGMVALGAGGSSSGDSLADAVFSRFGQGMLVGQAAAALIDAGIFAHEETPIAATDPAAARPREHTRAFSVMPVVGVAKGRSVLGLRGTF